MVQIMRNDVVTVGTTPTLISRGLAQGQRYVFIAKNTSTGGQVISLSWGDQVASGAGNVLNPGDGHSESVDSAFIPANTDIWGISSGAGGTLAIHERLEPEFKITCA